jgi:hypothetical protein
MREIPGKYWSAALWPAPTLDIYADITYTAVPKTPAQQIAFAVEPRFDFHCFTSRKPKIGRPLHR